MAKTGGFLAKKSAAPGRKALTLARDGDENVQNKHIFPGSGLYGSAVLFCHIAHTFDSEAVKPLVRLGSDGQTVLQLGLFGAVVFHVNTDKASLSGDI